jgi:hypothetical protein
MMPLSDDNFVITLGDRTLVLRPTLRAAFHLHQRYGFQALSREIAEGSFTAIVDLLNATSTTTPDIPLHALLSDRDTLLEFVLVLAGSSGTKSDKPQPGKSAKPISFDEYFTRLFQIGTGWLGWTPDDTWNATPAEILTAHQGRVEMLKAIFGKGDDEPSADIADGSLAGIRDGLNAIGDLQNHVMRGF